MHHFEVGLDGLLNRLALGDHTPQVGTKTLKVASGLGCSTISYALLMPLRASAAIALRLSKRKPESTAIAAYPFASPRFRALVPEMERKFNAGWKGLEKANPPTCSDFQRWS